jgi:RNA-directed DNA polymerase
MSLTTPWRIRRLQRKLYFKAKDEPAFRFYQLYDKVYREDILAHAYALAKHNGGAPGVDGMNFREIESQGREAWLADLRKELHDKTYKPDPVRRVMIPKPDGGERPLGIPTIRDRVVQTAAKLIVEPIFEADFEDSAYGYRPKRSATDAVRAVHRALCEGYTEVVDADLSKYFDTIPHAELMRSVARRVVDRQMLKLIKAWLKAPVEQREGRGERRMTGGKKSRQGTPQGGVISPLLANIYMHRYLRAWRQRGMDRRFGARIVNYADDFVILSRGHAVEALAWTRWAMNSIGLTMNETKTRICRAKAEPFDFLGYTFGPERFRGDGHWYLSAKPSKRSIQRVKQRVRQILHRGNVKPWPEVAEELNSVLRGWANYFSHGTRLMAYRAVDHYVYERARYFLRRRHKVSSRGTRRFPDHVVFEGLGVQRLRTLHLGPRPCALR